MDHLKSDYAKEQHTRHSFTLILNKNQQKSNKIQIILLKSLETVELKHYRLAGKAKRHIPQIQRSNVFKA